MSEPSGFDRLSPALQYQIVNTKGWRSLRPVQEQTIDAILDGDDCVVLAPTAGGKTEAAFFPLLSRMNDEDWNPTSVLYISPILALLNNQEDRVREYGSWLGRRGFKWHGDVGPTERRRFLEDPADILLTTPESIEAMMISPRVPTREIFAGLRAVVIDEVHAFADDDRGAHLSAVLERVSRFAGRELQRIGLSATVGNPAEILSWLRGSSERAGRVIDPGGSRKTAEIAIDYVGDAENAATVIKGLHPGCKRLVFVDSRKGAEELGRHLNDRAVRTFVTHGSLSVTMRRDAENAFTQGDDCVIVATSALELGIDVGDLDHVLQIDAPSSVASFMQRMGRTGRRDGVNPNCTFLVTRENRLLQAMALVRLYEQGYVEPVRPSRRAAHILAHQIMSIGVQLSGVGRHDWWAWLEGAAPFEQLTSDERESVVDWMLQKGILTNHDGRLWLGEEGEKKFGRANFRNLYAVFESARVMTVRHATQEIGSLDSSFLQSLQSDSDMGSFVLGGRAWQVIDVDWERGRCAVKPAPAGTTARWSGSGRFLSRELSQAMREILISDVDDPRWSRRARKALHQIRIEHAFLREGDDFADDGAAGFTWHNFAGGAANVLLAKVMEGELGGQITSRNTSITFTGSAGRSLSAIRDTMEKMRTDGRPLWSDAARFAPDATRSRLSKFQPCVPDALVRDLLVRRVVDLNGSRITLGLPPIDDEPMLDAEPTKVENPIVWIRTAENLAALEAKLAAEPFVALDVETTLKDHSLCLVQLGTRSTNYLIDPQVIDDLGPLARILQNERLPKVIHNAQFERSVLGALGMTIEPVIDTLVESRKKHGQLGGGHTLMAVARRELDVVLDKRWQTSDWTLRPLTPEQEAYAAMDVEVLVNLEARLFPKKD